MDTKDTHKKPTAVPPSLFPRPEVFHAGVLSASALLATVTAAINEESNAFPKGWESAWETPEEVLILTQQAVPAVAKGAALLLPPAYALLYCAKHCI